MVQHSAHLGVHFVVGIRVQGAVPPLPVHTEPLGSLRVLDLLSHTLSQGGRGGAEVGQRWGGRWGGK